MNTLEARRRLLGRNVYKRTTEGNPAIAQGSLARMYPGITMQGWTEQAQYEGKNLLPVDVGQEFDGTVVTDSATFEEDGVHAVFESIVSGEARDIYMYGDNHPSVEDSYVEVPILTPGDYRLVNDNIGISLYVVAWRNGASVVLGYVDNATTKITIQDGDKFRIFLRCNIIGDTDVKIHPMIVKEGEDTTQYEPYTGGQPSPNPDYPQEIVSAGKWNEETQKWEYEIEVGGANLWSFEQSIEFERSVRLSFNRELPAGEYTFSAVVHSTDTDASQCLLILLTADGGQMAHYIGRSDGNSRVSAKISISKPATKISLYASTLNVTSEGDTASFSDIMLNAGDTDLPYEPYRTPQTVTLTSDRPLAKWDKLEKRNGQWGWVYKSDVLEYDGDEGWIYDANNLRGEYSALYYYDTRVLNKDYSYCDKFGHIVYPYDGEGIMNNYGDSSSFYISIKSNRLASTDANGFKQWLQSNPLTVWYETAEETFVPLSESEQEALNTLYTFRPTTVLSNDCDCNMSLTYKTKKSMQSAPGGGILKTDGVTSEFIFPVKWNQVNKIVLKISGISSNQSIFVCGANLQNIWIGLNNDGVMSMIGLKKAVYNGAPENEIVDGKYHEMIFTFEKPVKDINISNVWDSVWSKNIIYHEIMFYDDDELLSDCVPYYKGAGYMLDKKNNIVIRASDPYAYQFA